MSDSERPYADRSAAGDALARALDRYAGRDDVLVLGLPRGGVPVAARVAAALSAPLDVLLVRKIGAPRRSELAMGAVAAVGDDIEIIRNDFVLRRVRPSVEQFDTACAREIEALRRRQELYRAGRAATDVVGRTVLLVDDGLATGSTMRAAVAAVRRRSPVRVVVAAPIGARRACADLASVADEVVCPWQPEPFAAVGQGYRDFGETSDDEVINLLR